MDKEEDIKQKMDKEETEEKKGGASQKKVIRTLIALPAIIVVIVVLVATLGNLGGREKRRVRPVIGEPARDFTYPDLDGNLVSLSDFYGKKVVFVNIWATWCKACKKELPTVQKMYDRFKGDDFEVLAVSIDAGGKKPVIPFMKKLGLHFPVLLDTTSSIRRLYGATGVPESFVIDKAGMIAFVEIGAGDWTEPGKQSLIKGLMDEPDREVKR